MNYKMKTLTALAAFTAALPLYGLVLSEVRVDQPGNPDDEEFIEIRGEPGQSLDGVWVLYVGDHSGTGATKGSGVVEIALNLTGYSIPADGHFLMLGPNFDGARFGLTAGDVDYLFAGFGNALENSDNVTVMLVRGWTGNGAKEVTGIPDQTGDLAVDIDDNDDGVPNATLPWSQLVDAAGIFESPTSGEFCYGAALGFVDVGPDGSFMPGHIWRASDTGVWQIGSYDVFAVDANGNVIGLDPDAKDTPGKVNPLGAPVTYPPVINALSTIFVAPGNIITVTGSNLGTVSSVKVDGLTAAFTASASELSVTIPDGATTGKLEVVNPDGTATAVNLLVVVDFATTLITEDFGAGLGDFIGYSVASTANWTPNTFRDASSIAINGFGADVASDDWLISPAIDLTSVTSAYLVIGHERAFSGPALEVKVSTNYTIGAPSTATWTNLAVALAGDNANEIVDSGKTDISAYAGQKIRVAIRYTSSGTGPGTGAIDRIHYFVVGGESLGWTDTAEYGWLYSLGAGWGFSYDLGYIYTGSFPWIYQTNFGWFYHVGRAPQVGIWLYSPTLEWVFVGEGDGGWFQSSANNWAYNNFITPQG